MFKKTFVLGIDSGCWDYLDPLLAAGRMSNLSRLIGTGIRGTLESTMPPITPVAFSSFATGVNPGKHGIFGWSMRPGGQAQSVPASASNRKGESFWRYLNAAGVRVGLLNVPITYPPQPLDGFLIAGLGVPTSSRNYTYPSELLDQIEAKFGPYHVDVPNDAIDSLGIEGFTAAWKEYERQQTDIALWLVEVFGVDVLTFNYASMDRINHLAPHQQFVEQTLTNIDRQIGRFIEHYPDANFVLMSDHGSRPVKSAFLLSKWLAEEGFLWYGEKSLNVPSREINFVLARYFQGYRGWNGFGERLARNTARIALQAVPARVRQQVWQSIHAQAPQALAYRFENRIDWWRTQAYARSNDGGIYINRRDRNAHGTVAPGDDYEQTRDALAQALLTVEDPISGERVFSRVYRQEEIYKGDALWGAPDLVADHYDSACDLIVDYDPEMYCFVDRRNRFGDHTRDGLFVLSGPDFGQSTDFGHRASIMDLPATLLHLHGVAVPEMYDGQPLTQFMIPEVASRPVVAFRPAIVSDDLSAEYSEDEMEQLTEHLRGLGYL